MPRVSWPSSGRLDYLTLEYLAELTMSILALQKQRHPEAGFAGDFLDVLQRLAPVLQRQPQLKIVTNAGGMNPHGLRRPRPRHPRSGGTDVSAASPSSTATTCCRASTNCWRKDMPSPTSTPASR